MGVRVSNGYKAALQRFEDAVREHAFRGTKAPGEVPHVDREYAEAKAALVRKLQYRALAADLRETR